MGTPQYSRGVQAPALRLAVGLLLFALTAAATPARESIWIEAEHLDGIRGYCWPMAADARHRTTAGHWGISGPGWAAEWTQGGESGFMSIACGADDDAAEAVIGIELPVDGEYHVWVRYRDTREQSNRFRLRIEQENAPPWTATYGEHPVVEEDNVMKLYWGWAFGWEGQAAALRKGPAILRLLSAFKERDCRQIDCIVLTTDPDYRPLIKDRPPRHDWAVLEDYRRNGMDALEPLARRRGDFRLPAAWQPRTFRDRGFLYLWNIAPDTVAQWAGDDPDTVRVPYHVRDPATVAAFVETYAGRQDVPIFSDPRIVPTFHGAGPGIMADEPFRRWLDVHPDRVWAGMMNYAPDRPLAEPAIAGFLAYRDRYVGSIAGESLGYFYPAAETMAAATAGATTRRELADAMSAVYLDANAAKYRTVFGEAFETVFGPAVTNAYRDVIACKSVGMTAYAPLLYGWGARTVGYESAVATYAVTAMQWAFLRGAARQHGGLTATYRSSNFGDAATMFSETQMYARPGNIIDNYYNVYAGAGMTWYKFDIWYQYMAGASMFYHEQGFDEFWMPGGTSIGGNHGLQLSPKGRLVDRFLRLTAAEPERGAQVTPVAFLIDYAHGWEPFGYQPRLYGGAGDRPDLTRLDDHARMLQEYLLFTAYYPIGPRSEEPITALSETFVPGVFGDLFDVIYAYPDPARWTTLDAYPVIILAGDLALTQAEGERLDRAVRAGGTLLVTDGQLSGPGLTALDLPDVGPLSETDAYRWLDDEQVHPAQRFRFRPIDGGRSLAATPDGQSFCAAYDRGAGRLIYLAVPHGLGIDRAAVPVVARLFAHLTRGLMPIEVEGDVQWMVNRLTDGWAVTLFNPAGAVKPQHGIFPTDFRENRTVTLRAQPPVTVTAARDRLLPADRLTVQDNAVRLTVQAGAVRVIVLEGSGS